MLCLATTSTGTYTDSNEDWAVLSLTTQSATLTITARRDASHQ
jgi:hypothetical protein